MAKLFNGKWLCVLGLCTALSMHAGEKATVFRVRPAIALQSPLQGDSINFNGEKFTPKQLLQTKVDLDFDGYAHTRLETDTAGYVTVGKAEKDALLYLFSTRLRAERFTKGTLKISSPARWEVFVDGESKHIKDSTEDSLSAVRPVEVSLRLEPETDYDITIKLLSTAEDKTTPTLKCEFVPDKEAGRHVFG